MHVLDNLVSGAVRCVYSTSPQETIKSLIARSKSFPISERIVVCETDPALPIYESINGLVNSLAKAALLVWPDWYGNSNLFPMSDESSLQPALDVLASQVAARCQRSVLQHWILTAVKMCRACTPPVVSDFSPTVQVQQLSLAIANNDLTLVVRPLSTNNPDSIGLLGLAKNLEWLALHGSARVVTVLPAAWAGRAELDGISWDCRRFDEQESNHTSSNESRDEPPMIVSPIHGRPHPSSPGEQLIASRLKNDPLMDPLFEYNMRVTTVRETRYLVDLVWFEGKIVVEIDGYEFHSSRLDFENDRQRDYELQLSGYIVLRLTHDSVMKDVELAMDKIRDLVKLRMGQQRLTRCTNEP